MDSLKNVLVGMKETKGTKIVNPQIFLLKKKPQISCAKKRKNT
jgi:hypothetical protein